jgi:hypothetical protein
MKRNATSWAVLAALVAVFAVPGSALAIDGRYAVKAVDVYVRSAPQSYAMGRLYNGQSMDIQYVDSNGWAYGFAYGYVNRCVWAMWSAFGSYIGARGNGCRTSNMYLALSEFSDGTVWGSGGDGAFHRISRNSEMWDNWAWSQAWGNHKYRGTAGAGTAFAIRYRTKDGQGVMARIWDYSDWVFIQASSL